MTILRTTGHVLPEQVQSNAELAVHLDVRPEWIEQRTGIRNRRRAQVPTSALAAQAGARILTRSGLGPEQIDYLIVGTTTPDYQNPGVAPIVQAAMGLGEIPCLDIRQTCVSSIYGLKLADSLVKAGQARTVLLLTAESHTRFLPLAPEYRHITPLFGDAASGALVTGESADGGLEIVGVREGTDGAYARSLMVAAPGSASGSPWNYSPDDYPQEYRPTMDGLVVIRHAGSRLIEICREMLDAYGLTMADMACVVLHQANGNLLRILQREMEVDDERFINLLAEHGNTGAASPLLALDTAWNQILQRPEPYVLMLAFGAGFTWGGALLRKTPGNW